MPIVQSFDGINRRIILDASVADNTWSPLDLFKEYLIYRRDNHTFRGFEPLIRMRGGEPKGGGKFAPRFLQMLTDSRGITTKLVLPDNGPYRTFVDGEIATDVADVDPEAFDVGASVRMHFRVKHFDAKRGYRSYFWKAAPVSEPAKEN